jgi:hypothetical protein
VKPHVAILSGGSEIVSLALVEELLTNGFQPIIIALRKDSLFRGLSANIPFTELDWNPAETDSDSSMLAAGSAAVGRKGS